MRSSKIGLVRSLILGGAVAMMAACGGGGGGSSGGGLPGGPTPTNEYVISLRADQTELPLNIAGALPGIGGHAPYTTTLYVTARRKGTNDPIPGGDDVFACNVIPEGLQVGALYYLDGDSEHEDEDGFPLAYRSVTLGANSGGASFHFHTGSTAGTATITCTVFDPLAQVNRSTSIQIQVGQATGVPSQVLVNAAAPQYLFAQGTGGSTQIQLQVQVLDDLGQQVPNPPPGVNNVYARIVPTGNPASANAKLRGTGQDNTWVRVRSTNGQAQFSLISGAQMGAILVEVMADRFDNNVDNGISQVITNLVVIPVVVAVGQADLVIEGAGALPAAFEGNSYAAILSAAGGLPPYSWSLLPPSGLPLGLSLSPAGVITGRPLVSGTHSFAVRVQDSSLPAWTAQATYSISITAAPPEPDPEPFPLQITTSSLPDGTVTQPYVAIATASGASGSYSWSATGLPAGISIDANGVISGTPVVADTYSVALTATSAGTTANRIVQLVINP